MEDLNVCSDEWYLPDAEIDDLRNFGWRVHNVINDYRRYLRRRKTSGTLHETGSDYGSDNIVDVFDDCR